MKKITILFQFGNRKYIEDICRKFLNESIVSNLSEAYICEWKELDCTNISIGKGFNQLVNSVETEYVLWTPDDFAFFPNGTWIDKALKILYNRKDIGIIDLRKENDGETPWMVDKREFIEDQSFFLCRRWADRRFNLTPFIARTEDIKKILPLNEQDETGNIAEAEGYIRWPQGLKLARLDIPFKGVCFHMGWNRSRYN
jgi:hypothetical protein